MTFEFSIYDIPCAVFTIHCQSQVVAVQEDHIKVRYKNQKGQTKTMELTREFFADEDLSPGISEILVDLGDGSEQSRAR